MKLKSECIQCKNNIEINSFWISDKIELAQKKGSEFVETCKQCGANVSIHVDDVYAEINLKYILFVGVFSVILAIILTIIFWNAGYLAWMTIGIPIALTQYAYYSDGLSVRQFNEMYYDINRMRKKTILDKYVVQHWL